MPLEQLPWGAVINYKTGWTQREIDTWTSWIG